MEKFTTEQIAKKLGVSKTTILNHSRLLIPREKVRGLKLLFTKDEFEIIEAHVYETKRYRAYLGAKKMKIIEAIEARLYKLEQKIERMAADGSIKNNVECKSDRDILISFVNQICKEKEYDDLAVWATLSSTFRLRNKIDLGNMPITSAERSGHLLALIKLAKEIL